MLKSGYILYSTIKDRQERRISEDLANGKEYDRYMDKSPRRIQGAHSPNQRASMSSFKKFRSFYLEVLEAI